MEIENFNFEQNFFALFDLPVGCVVDASSLRDSFMQLQRQYHPDRFAAESDTKRRRAVQIAAFINGAHQTLQNPLKRAEYCLELAGLSTDPETDSSMDAMFLMQQMELRESLEEVSSAADPVKALSTVSSEIDGLIQTTSTQAAELIGESQYEEAREMIRRWQFLEKLSSEADSLEAQLDET